MTREQTNKIIDDINIEKNCFEYPKISNTYYWPCPGYCKLPEEFMHEITKSIIKEFSDKYEPF